MDRAELATFLDAGPAMLGASADESHRPECFRVWGAWLDDDHRLRALVASDAGRTMTSVGPGARVSFTFTDITSFESVQVKGRAVAAAAPPGPADLERMRRYNDLFTAALATVGHRRQAAETMRPLSVFVLVVDVDELYDQTPGPGAGARVRAELT